LNNQPTGTGCGTTTAAGGGPAPNEEFGDADLYHDLAEMTRTANRANVTIYSIDPRGLVAGSDVEEQLDPAQWTEYVAKSQDSLRVLAAGTGGMAVVSRADFDQAIQRLDNDMSDYYVLGYYSSNPNPNQRRRRVEIRVTRPGAVVASARKEYEFKMPRTR
jgi:VWFA-related protein